MPGTPRRLLPLALAATSVALVLLAGCASSDPGSGAPTSSSTTTTSGAGSTGTTPGTTPGTTEPDDPDGPGTTVESLDNADIKAALEVSDPELWALVDYEVMSWSAFGGYVVPVPVGTDVATAIELCDAVAEVVDEGPPEAIVIATGVDVDDLEGTPIVERAFDAPSCVAV